MHVVCILCVHICIHEYTCQQKLEEDFRFPGAQVTCSCEWSDTGSGKQAQFPEEKQTPNS